jgi:hypothetical protein
VLWADQACEGIGHNAAGESAPIDQLQSYLRHSLNEYGTLCDQARTFVIRVLPKYRTPRCGYSIRSLTHHLALIRTSEVEPVWIWNSKLSERCATVATDFEPGKALAALNILALPWPLTLDPSAFIDAGPRACKSLPPEFGFFDFAPGPQDVCGAFKRIYKDALKQSGHIDFVVLPEQALSHDEFVILEEELAKEKDPPVLVAGVRGKSLNGRASNRVAFWLPDTIERYEQAKHHRWALDEHQLRAYRLGARLSVHRRWWENSELESRRIHFTSVGTDLLYAVLICEDLARQDPVVNLVRSVGPNLVFALLLDGPQNLDRWSAQYASVLADDPGTSVLTLTSAGMVRLRHPLGDATVGLWRDSSQRPIPITLPMGHSAAILSVSFARFDDDITADSRRDPTYSTTPHLVSYITV